VLLKEALNSAIAALTEAQAGSPRLNAETLLMFALRCDRAHLFAHPERELTSREQINYQEAIAQRASGIPTQYITGHQEFWGMDLIVSPAVLIPRPETEHVVEAALSLTDLVSRARTPGLGHEPRIIDVGTGSGCIALALAKELPQADIHASDISPAALEVARANAARHRFDRIQFHQTDLLRGFAPGSFDLIVSNPPYVGESEEDQVQLEVRKHEPRNAVFAGPTGLEVIDRLVPQAYTALKPAGFLIMEMSGTIAESVKHLLAGWSEVRVINDLQGIPRVAMAAKPS
jgi:release factor glutamine methyltransferase